jgi:hypothetical protein
MAYLRPLPRATRTGVGVADLEAEHELRTLPGETRTRQYAIGQMKQLMLLRPLSGPMRTLELPDGLPKCDWTLQPLPGAMSTPCATRPSTATRRCDSSQER